MDHGRGGREAGGRIWRWPVQSTLERGVAPLRLTVAVANGAALALLPHPLPGDAALAWILAAAFAAYSLVALGAAHSRTEWLRRHPDLMPLLDGAFTLAWILATGARQSPFAPIVFLAAAAVPLRLTPRRQVLAAAVLAAFALVVAAPGRGISALYVLVCGCGLAAWSRGREAVRRNALRDTLTGSLGRDYALVQIESLLEREALPFAIALADLDGFEGINAAHGRLAGDAALRECAARIQAVIRPSDVLARFAGDAFLVVFPEAVLADGLAAAERIRVRVASSRFPLRAASPPVPLSVSVGVAEARAGQSLDDLLRLAEAGLHAAKAGRDRVAAGAG